MSETKRRAIIRPIRKAAGAWNEWPEEMVGQEIEAEVHRKVGKFFCTVHCPGLISGSGMTWVLHGEAELVRFLEE